MAEFPSARAALAVFTQSCRPGAAGVVDDYAALGRPWGFAVEQISVPVHCWHATSDDIVPMRHTDELVRRIPGAQLTRWEGEGHLAIVDHVGEVFDALLGARLTATERGGSGRDEVLAQRLVLALVVRADALAVETRRALRACART